jgi:hypothetical protein
VRHIRICSRIKNPAHLCAGIIALGLLAGCGKTADDSGDAAGASGSAETYDGPPLTFDEALTQVLVPSCGFDSCHGSGAGYLRINEDQTEEEWLEFKSSLLVTRNLVVPGSASTSYLIKKMEGSSDIEGEVMPPSGSLNGERIGMVRSWIDNIETD